MSKHLLPLLTHLVFSQIEEGSWYDSGTTIRKKATQYYEVVGHQAGRCVKSGRRDGHDSSAYQ